MKKCPYCAEEIQDAAIKCRFCGEWFEKKEDDVDEEHTRKNMLIKENVMNCLKAAEQGDKISQTHLGEMYLYGKGVAQDYAEAVKWFRKAGGQGYADAQLKIVGKLNNHFFP